MKTKIIITGIILGLACLAQATALGDLASGMQPGTWAALNTADINPTLSEPGQASGIIFGYTEYIKWDPVSRRLIYLGGDHWTSGTPIMRHVQYDDATNTWSRLAQQSWFTVFASHGYDHAAIDPVNRYFYFRPPGNAVIRRWNIDTGVWTSMPANNVIQYNSCCVGIEYSPELQGVLWASDESGTAGGITILNDATDQWARVGQAAAYDPMGSLHNFAEYNPVHKVVVFGGGSSGAESRGMFKLNAAGAVTALKAAPVDLGIQNAVFTVDPVSGDYLVFTTTSRFYVYNVVNDTWTLRASGPSVPVWTTHYSNPVHGVVAGPVSTYGVNVFVTCDGSNNCKVSIYKHSAGTGKEAKAKAEAKGSISIWPSPARGAVRFSLPARAAGNGVARFRIFDVRGVLVKTLMARGVPEAAWNTEGFSPGVYIVKAEASRHRSSRKFLIQ